jgi:hypothetical protein
MHDPGAFFAAQNNNVPVYETPQSEISAHVK